MDLKELLQESVKNKYNVTIINTKSYFDYAAKVRSSFRSCIVHDNSIGLHSKGNVANFSSYEKAVSNRNTSDMINKYYMMCSGEAPLILVNPTDISTVKFADSLYKFDFTLYNSTDLNKKRKLHVIIIAPVSESDINALSKFSFVYEPDGLTEDDLKDILKTKYSRLPDEQKKVCKKLDHLQLRQQHRKNLPNAGKKYYSNFEVKNLSLTNEHVYRIDIPDELNIYGMDELKHWITKRKILLTGDHPISMKGISVLGIPGTGKSLSSRLIAKTLDLPLYRFDVHSLLDQYLGNSEKNVNQALKYLDSISPCVVLVDEVDKMFSRSDNEHQSSKRVMGILLQYMEQQNSVFWVFTGNNIDNIPPELLRKGRLDEFFYSDKPSIENLIKYAEGLLELYSEYEVVLSEATHELIRRKISSGTYLYPDIEAFMQDLYLHYQQSKCIALSYIEDYDIISSFSRYENEYNSILRWSSNNAKETG